MVSLPPQVDEFYENLLEGRSGISNIEASACNTETHLFACRSILFAGISQVLL